MPLTVPPMLFCFIHSFRLIFSLLFSVFHSICSTRRVCCSSWTFFFGCCRGASGGRTLATSFAHSLKHFFVSLFYPSSSLMWSQLGHRSYYDKLFFLCYSLLRIQTIFRWLLVNRLVLYCFFFLATRGRLTNKCKNNSNLLACIC